MSQRPTRPVPDPARFDHAYSPDGPTETDAGTPLLDELPFMDEVPFLTCPSSWLLDLDLDHRAAFILSLVDGESNVESVFDASPMSSEETCCVLVDLVQRGLVATRAPRDAGLARSRRDRAPRA